MWGGLGRSSKMKIAREAIAQSLLGLDGRLALGLVAYGHRRRGYCGDIEALQPVAPLNARRIAGIIKKIQPVGKTPISGALREAARLLSEASDDPDSGDPSGASGDRARGPDANPVREGGAKASRQPGSIVLLSDGYENCRQDPCATVRALRRMMPGLRFHVIALAMKPEDLQRIQCVARLGGGKLVEVASRDELEEALSEVFTDIAAAPRFSGWDTAARGARSDEPQGPPRLALRAVLAEGQRLPLEGVYWRVRNKADGAKPLYEKTATAPVIDLAPGRYVVEARLGLVSARREVEVQRRGTTRVSLSLNGGLIRARTFASRAGAILDNVYYTLSRREPGSAGNEQLLAVSREPSPAYVVPPGAYAITVRHGLARRTHNVTIRAGDVRNIDIVLDVGTLSLRAVAADGRGEGDGSALRRMLFLIYEDDPAAPGGLREVARSAADRPVFTLPAGLYHVIARYGLVQSRKRVTIRPGARTEQVMVLAAGRILGEARIRGEKRALDDLVTYHVFAAAQGGTAAEGASPNLAPDLEKALVRTSVPAPVIRLGAGRYRLVATLGPTRVAATTTVALAPGESKRALLEFDAGWLSLRLVQQPGGPPLGDVFWRVLDDRGEEVWSTGLPTPSAPLGAGAYEVQVTYRERRFTRRLVVHSGERQDLELVTSAL